MKCRAASVIATGYGHIRGLADRVVKIFLREGSRGLYDRLRHPKPLRGRWNKINPLLGPVLIQGGKAEWHLPIAKALQNAGIAVATLSDDYHQSIIHINPAHSDDLPPSRRHIFIFISTSKNAKELRPLARRIQTVLSDCPDLLSALHKQGFPIEKLFSLKGPDCLQEGLIRYLIAVGSIQVGAINWRNFSDLKNLSPHRLCLSLPESLDRREQFLRTNPGDFETFDGIRFQPGWIGTAASFKVMAQACLDKRAYPVLICEDDVEFLPSFLGRFEVALEFLEGRDWDIFSGIITDVGPDYIVKGVSRYRGEVFVELNRCVGMVCNLYNHTALGRLSAWDVDTGMTIDRYLERAGDVRVVTTVPFLAGHSENLVSTLWRFNNQRYRGMIRASEERLVRLVAAYEARCDSTVNTPNDRH